MVDSGNGSSNSTGRSGVISNATASKPTFPYPDSKARLKRYALNASLFDGNHFEAFNAKIDNENFNKAYSKLRYIVNNFPALISKICADMLFGDAPRISFPKGSNGDNNADWLKNWLHDSDVMTTFYESAMTSSSKGDTLFKLRVGPLHDPKTSSIIVEQVQPDFYFPKLDKNNATAEPSEIEIAFVTHINDKDYLRKEIHTAGRIVNELWLLEDEEVVEPADLSLLGDPDIQPIEETGIDRLLVIHVPNWKDGRTHFGNDDYTDLLSLFYAINNRFTKVDNILDKHSDPILAIPEGILDENGNVKRENLGLFEKDESGNSPEYIVWNASLESAFSEIDRLMQSLYMFSEISPDAFGKMDDATAASGRALKYRMMRTVAKVKRKQLYLDRAIKEVVYVAQLLAQKYKIKALGEEYTGAPAIPSIEWKHPIPQDSYEQAQEEELRLASGNQTVRDSIMNIDGLTEEEADEKVEEIIKEQEAMAPQIAVPIPGSNDPSKAEPNIAVPGQSPKTTPSGQPKSKNIQVPKTTKPADVSL